jgi:tetratricopeptide (TPR) repeat protein
MIKSARIAVPALLAVFIAGLALPALANPQVLERARKLLAESNPKQAYVELIAIQSTMTGTPEYDYLLGVAALDSGRFEDAIIAFERVLALIPAHAGAQMDLGRAYFALGSYDLAEAAFRRLKDSNPPGQALQAINQYLEAIQNRKRETTPGWTGFAELAIGYDSNLTGVPGDFGAASQQSFNIATDPTGNSIKRKEAYFEAQGYLEYSRPLSRGWSVFAGGGARGRAYNQESDFNIITGDLRGGAALNDGPTQWRLTTGYQNYNQEGAAPGDPKPTNDRTTANAVLDWRRAIDTRNQVGLGLQVSAVRFPDNRIDDFDQLYLSASWLRSFEARGVPLLYLTVFGTDDHAKNTFDDGVTDKSKNLAGVRSYFQYSLGSKLQAFNAVGFVLRRDKDSFARSTTIEKGRDKFLEFTLGLTWNFSERCATRTQWSYTQNASNIDIFDFNRNEVSTAVRCDLF